MTDYLTLFAVYYDSFAALCLVHQRCCLCEGYCTSSFHTSPSRKVVTSLVTRGVAEVNLMVSPLHFDILVEPATIATALRATLRRAAFQAVKMTARTRRFKTVTNVTAIHQQSTLVVIHLILANAVNIIHTYFDSWYDNDGKTQVSFKSGLIIKYLLFIYYL